MNREIVNCFVEVICLGVRCDNGCACKIDGNCKFEQLSGRELAAIARDRFIKKGCPADLKHHMDIINREYPAKAKIV